MTQSLNMPPAKKMDRKNTPPQEIIPSRRSTRTKTSALANKFGNAIPINTITNDNTSDNEVCLITVQHQQDKNAEPIGQAGTAQELSTDIECIENNTTDKTPEQLRVQETNEGTGGPITSIGDASEPNDTLHTPTKTTTYPTSPQSNPSDILVSKLNTSATSAQRSSSNSPIQRAISSRYVIDRPTGTSCSPDKSFIDSFNDAMKILKSISPPKNSMTFQRECERQDRPKCLIKHAKEAKSNEPATQQIPQTSWATKTSRACGDTCPCFWFKAPSRLMGCSGTNAFLSLTCPVLLKVSACPSSACGCLINVSKASLAYRLP